MKTDRRVRLNCLNWLMNQLNNLDATIVVLLETRKLMKQGSGDSDVRALVVDARDFVRMTYTVMVKNGSLEVTIWVLVILKGLKNKTKEFLFEGRHWRMDVDSLMMTVKSVVEPYWVQGEDCWVKSQYGIMGPVLWVLTNNGYIIIVYVGNYYSMISLGN